VGLAGHDASFNALVGSSFRIAIDVGEWDRSQVINCPGQSGDPRSPHYADLLGLWSSGESFPLLYSRNAVEASAPAHIMLHAPVADVVKS
jgi:penicillin amidase